MSDDWTKDYYKGGVIHVPDGIQTDTGQELPIFDPTREEPLPAISDFRQGQANSKRFEDCWNAMVGIEDPAAFIKEARAAIVSSDAIIDSYDKRELPHVLFYENLRRSVRIMKDLDEKSKKTYLVIGVGTWALGETPSGAVAKLSNKIRKEAKNYLVYDCPDHETTVDDKGYMKYKKGKEPIFLVKVERGKVVV